MKTFDAHEKEAASESTSQPLSPETIQALQELGGVFRNIHRRLLAEGYTYRDGKLNKPEAADKPENGTKG